MRSKSSSVLALVALAACSRRHKPKVVAWAHVSSKANAKWRNLNRKRVKTASPVPKPPPLDPTTGPSNSPIVAAALCIKQRGLLTANQAAKVDAMKRTGRSSLQCVD